MLWKKKAPTIDQKKESDTIRVTVIPEVFYGGADPLIYHADVSKKSSPIKVSSLPAKTVSSAAVVPSMSKKKIIIIISALSLLIVVGISFYYFRQGSTKDVPDSQKLATGEPEQKTEPIVTPTPTPPTPEVVTTTPIVVPDPVVTPVTPTSTKPLTFPMVLLKDGVDLDVDSLTDEEEEIFKTDSGTWDTDKDGYYDGQEVVNLYNPTGFAPVRIVDSGLVREYINPMWKYRLYHPIDWAVASVDVKSDHVLFSSITGDYVEVRAIPNDASDSFPTWFSKNIIGQNFSDLSMFNNRFGVSGYKRQDSLVSYFPSDKVVYVIIYQPASDATDIPFRHMVQMMFQSFRTSMVIITDIPDQVILPQTMPAETTTSTL